MFYIIILLLYIIILSGKQIRLSFEEIILFFKEIRLPFNNNDFSPRAHNVRFLPISIKILRFAGCLTNVIHFWLVSSCNPGDFGLSDVIFLAQLGQNYSQQNYSQIQHYKLFYKENFYKKMSLKNPKSLRKC